MTTNPIDAFLFNVTPFQTPSKKSQGILHSSIQKCSLYLKNLVIDILTFGFGDGERHQPPSPTGTLSFSLYAAAVVKSQNYYLG